MTDNSKIDLIDAKILRTLLIESRTSFTQIAKDCDISVGAVRKRYKRLWRLGIVNGEIMQVNPYYLGYKCVSTVTIKTAQNDEDKVIEFLKSKPYCAYTFKNVFGLTNMAAVVIMRDIQEISGIIREIEAHPLVKQADAKILTNMSGVDHPENLVIPPLMSRFEQKPNYYTKPNSSGEIKFDKKDREIAKLLTNNSRVPFKQIAEKLDVSTKNVIERYNKLRGTLLSRSTITISLKKIGYEAFGFMFVRVENRGKMPEILEKILSIQNLIVVLENIGDYNLFIFALKDFNELFELKEKFDTIEGIRQLDAFVNKPYESWPLNMFASLL